MHITFIKPNMGLVGARPYYDRGRMEPLTFAVLKGMTPARHDVVLFDDRFEAVPYDDPTDLVAINTEIYTARRSYEIADQFRARGVKVAPPSPAPVIRLPITPGTFLAILIIISSSLMLTS